MHFKVQKIISHEHLAIDLLNPLFVIVLFEIIQRRGYEKEGGSSFHVKHVLSFVCKAFIYETRWSQRRVSIIYSVLKLFTGFAIAALIA